MSPSSMLCIAAVSATREVFALIRIGGGNWQSTHVARSPGGALDVARRSGPLSSLTDEVVSVVPTLGEAVSVPVGSISSVEADALPLEDALVLADATRAGDAELVATALDLAGRDRCPQWLAELAFGARGALSVLLRSGSGPPALLLLAHAVPSGWCRLEIDESHYLRGRFVDDVTLQTELARACHRALPLAA